MTRGVFAVERGLGLREAARRMVERGVGAAIVLDGERLVGILTERDVLLAVASDRDQRTDRKSTRLNSSHVEISYAVFCLKKKKNKRLSKRDPTRRHAARTQLPCARYPAVGL